MSLKAAALIVVMLSKHKVKETKGAARAFITMVFEVTGLFVMQDRLEFITHCTISPLLGNERIG